ncbi:MAG: hypothetical protein IKY90_02120 [Oscillospiraceae bacterium]|nr:hypothetical protein [Oscillospiraceae bacterium]
MLGFQVLQTLIFGLQRLIYSSSQEGLFFCADKYTDNNFDETVYNMQREFNEQGITDKYGNKLKEDGIYGPNTQWARNAYIGMFPSTNIIDPLQSKITDVGYRKFVKGHGKLPPTVANTKYQLYDKRNNSRLFEIEYHPIKTNTQAIRHINTVSPKGATKLQKKAADSLNHKEVSQEVFDNFRNFDEIIDNVKFAGKAVATAGVVPEAVEYGDTVYRDLNDADGKLGKETLKASVGIVGEWAGGLTGAKLGAMGGAAFGSAILLGAGTAVGGFVGGTIGGIIGSIAGNDLAEGFIEGYYTGD